MKEDKLSTKDKMADPQVTVAISACKVNKFIVSLLLGEMSGKLHFHPSLLDMKDSVFYCMHGFVFIFFLNRACTNS